MVSTPFTCFLGHVSCRPLTSAAPASGLCPVWELPLAIPWNRPSVSTVPARSRPSSQAQPTSVPTASHAPSLRCALTVWDSGSGAAVPERDPVLRMGGGLGQCWSPGSAPPRPWPSDDRSETSEGLGSQGAMQHHRAGKSPWQGSNSLPRGCGICHRETDTEGSSQGCDRCWKGPRTLG